MRGATRMPRVVGVSDPGALEEAVAVLRAVDALEQVAHLALLPLAARRSAGRFWPGPLALVLPLVPGIELPTSRWSAPAIQGSAGPRAAASTLCPTP
jgi:hypothetical protein